MPVPGIEQIRTGAVRRALLVLGVGALVAGLWSSVAEGRSRDNARIDDRLTTRTSHVAEVMTEHFDQARLVILLAAQNPALHAARSIDSDPVVADQAERVLAAIEDLYPSGAVHEVCVIDGDGRELARNVLGNNAPPDELSPNEAGNEFFHHTQTLADGEVLNARPYVSPDTDEWVISTSTVMPATDGGQLILHYEVSLESFRHAMEDAEGGETTIVQADTGVSLFGSEGTLDPTRSFEDNDSPFAPVTRTGQADGTLRLGGTRVAYARVGGDAHNQNEWYVVSSAPTSAVTFRSGWTPQSVAILAAGLAVLAFVALSATANRRQLHSAAHTDMLTGLPNRTELLERTDHAIRRVFRSFGTVVLVVIDINRFKEVNDVVGQDAGDDLLRAVAARLRAAHRVDAIVARLGADQFGVLLRDVAGPADALAAGKAAIECLQVPFNAGDTPLHITASAGVALYPIDGFDASAILHRAEDAMHRAKQDHLGVALAEAVQHDAAVRRLRIAAELALAVRGRELHVHYQPKLDLSTGRPAGVEALVRWTHAELGVVGPDEFVPIAEETGWIGELTSFVLDEALDRCASWQTEGLAATMSVNISMRGVSDGSLPDHIAAKLATHGLPGSALTLELTETAIVDDLGRAVEVLGRVRELGVRVSVDDFGTGYFALSKLRELAVDEIKIDRSFVMSPTARDVSIVDSTIKLGRDLGVTIVAEGVEELATLESLRERGCDIAQGYLLSPPLPPDEAGRWLAEWASGDRAPWLHAARHG